MEGRLCSSSACQSLWLNAFPITPTDGVRTTLEDLDDAIASCFQLINETCADCAKEHGLEDVCPHVLYHALPQPISSHFDFCSGQVLTNGDSMSTVAWMRFIAWRNERCKGWLQRSAWRTGVPLPEGGLLAYYEKPREGVAGSLGWTQLMS